MKRIIIFVVTSILLVSCAALSYQIYSNYDKFNDVTTEGIHRNFTECDRSLLQSFSIAFDMVRSISKSGTYNYINIYYLDSDWLFIDQGESLVLLIDGNRIGLSGDGSIAHRNVITGNLISESALYDINNDLIQKILKSRSIEFQLIGRYKRQCKLTDINLQRIKEFLSKK